MNRALLILATLTVGTSHAHAKTWAVQFPFNNGELSPVFHARNADAALIKAITFCKKTELCQSEYPDGEIKTVTAIGVVGYSNLFVTTLCRQDNGEHAYVTVTSVFDDMAGREDGLAKGKEAIKRAGHSTHDCTLHAVYGVKSRDRLQSGLIAQALEQENKTLKGEIRSYKVQRRNARRTAVEILE